VIRALITAALLAGAAMHFGVDPNIALGYALVLTVMLWFLWPPVRVITRLIRRRRRRSHPNRTPARATTAAAPQLTQINHHHHYYAGLPPAAAPSPRPDYSRPALPERTEGQKRHDAIYDTIIDIDETP
jgi:ABC-type nickel/cobalt efflux system permease component RcnA